MKAKSKDELIRRTVFLFGETTPALASHGLICTLPQYVLVAGVCREAFGRDDKICSLIKSTRCYRGHVLLLVGAGIWPTSQQNTVALKLGGSRSVNSIFPGLWVGEKGGHS